MGPGGGVSWSGREKKNIKGEGERERGNETEQRLRRERNDGVDKKEMNDRKNSIKVKNNRIKTTKKNK